MQVEEGAKSGIKNRCISEETKEWLGKCKIGMSDKSETARGEVRKGLATRRKPIICSEQSRAQP
jgi:hypothetical protein